MNETDEKPISYGKDNNAEYSNKNFSDLNEYGIAEFSIVNKDGNTTFSVYDVVFDNYSIYKLQKSITLKDDEGVKNLKIMVLDMPKL